MPETPSQFGPQLVAGLNEILKIYMQQAMVEVHTRLLGYEAALAVLIAALDKAGALPIASAKQAIDATAAAYPNDALNAPIRAVLQQPFKAPRAIRTASCSETLRRPNHRSAASRSSADILKLGAALVI